MWFNRFAPARRPRRDRGCRRLTVEPLEDRCLPASTPSAALVADIVPGGAGSNPSALVPVNGTLFFVADDGLHGPELWKSNGTAAGTVLVKDINPGGGSHPAALTKAGGTLYFTTDDGVHGAELWKSDGTAAGTVMVRDIYPGGGSSGPTGLTEVKGTVFFAATDPNKGRELWKSDGTAAGTVLVKDIVKSGDSNPRDLIAVNETLFFSAYDKAQGTELWKSDGTAAGTVLVKDINRGRDGSFAGPANMTNVSGTLYFTPSFAVGSGRSRLPIGFTHTQLWKSDGTAAGTVLVKDIRAESLTDVDGTLFFTAGQVWKSDGTPDGTVPVTNFPSHPDSTYPAFLTNVNGLLYFTADDGTTGLELWRTDGTAAGTVLVKDISPGADANGRPNQSIPFHLTNVNGLLYFTAEDGSHGRELWQSDGTAAGTVMVRDIYLGAEGSHPDHLVAMNNMLYFSADDGVHGRELWDPPPVVPPLVPRDPRFGQQWALEVIQAPEAWNFTTGSTRVTVAVVDSGIEYTHPDLYLNVWINQDEIPRAVRPALHDVDGDGLITFWDLNEPVNQGPGKITDLNGTGFIDGGDLLRPVGEGGWADGVDDGGNGFTDDLIGWDFVEDDNDPMDTHGHGTATAGIIGAAGDNGVGVAGINWQIQLMAVRAYPDNNPANYQEGDLAASIHYAVNNQARILYSGGAPASVVPPSESQTLREAITHAADHDRLYVTVAGGVDRFGLGGLDTDVVPHLPSSLNLANMITVAATNRGDRLDPISNFGANTVHLAAPGRVVLAPWIGGTYFPFWLTSAAAPHVAGAAALILSINPHLSVAEINALILDNVDPLPDLQGKTVTGGRLNLFKALGATPPASALPGGPLNLANAFAALAADLTAEPPAEAPATGEAVGGDPSGPGGAEARTPALPGVALGLALGNPIWFDAVWGGFLDPTSGDAGGFTTPGAPDEPGRRDRLTGRGHWPDHLLGSDHEGAGGMQETLTPGGRREVSAEGDAFNPWHSADALFALLAAHKDQY